MHQIKQPAMLPFQYRNRVERKKLLTNLPSPLQFQCLVFLNWKKENVFMFPAGRSCLHLFVSIKKVYVSLLICIVPFTWLLPWSIHMLRNAFLEQLALNICWSDICMQLGQVWMWQRCAAQACSLTVAFITEEFPLRQHLEMWESIFMLLQDCMSF